MIYRVFKKTLPFFKILSVSFTLASCKSEISITKNSLKPALSESTPGSLITLPIAKNLSPANAYENSQRIIVLEYTDEGSDLALSCEVSNLINLTETSGCSCNVVGVCSVGVIGTLDYSGGSSFNYTITDTDGQSNIAEVTLTINNLISCPTGFIPVLGNDGLGVSDFCVMKYEAKDRGDGHAVSKPEDLPYGGISPPNSQIVCDAMTVAGFPGTFTLISNKEWMTIARDIESVPSNWSGGTLGAGHIPSGHSDFFPTNMLAVLDTADPYDGTANNPGEAPGSGWEQKRTHTLKSEGVIWDLAGNADEWVDWSPDDVGHTLGPVNETSVWRELTVDPSGSVVPDDFRPSGPYDSNNSFGQWKGGAGGALSRGGNWTGITTTGIFKFSLADTNMTGYTNTAFRCVYRPL